MLCDFSFVMKDFAPCCLPVIVQASENMEVKCFTILWFVRFGSTVVLPLTLFPFLLQPHWVHAAYTQDSWVNYFFIYFWADKQPRLLAGISSLPLPAPPSSSSMRFALICPESSSVTGRGSLSTSTIVVGAIITLAPNAGFEVKAWLESKHYQINNTVLSRHPGNSKNGGFPAFVSHEN